MAPKKAASATKKVAAAAKKAAKPAKKAAATKKPKADPIPTVAANWVPAADLFVAQPPRMTNGLLRVDYAPHIRDVLSRYLAAAEWNVVAERAQDHTYGHVWVSKDAAVNVFGAKLKPEFEEIAPCRIPDVDHPLSLSVDGESEFDFPTREMYHSCFFDKDVFATDEAIGELRIQLPRSAETGQFFTDEEVADRLNDIGRSQGFTSNLWFSPALIEESNGRHELRTGMRPFTVCQTARIFTVPEEVEVPAAVSRVPEGTPKAAGGNSINGLLTSNPALLKRLRSGSMNWVTQQQVEYFAKLGLKVNLPPGATPDNGSLATIGATYETRHFRLFNADQLVVPGRIGLKPRGEGQQLWK